MIAWLVHIAALLHTHLRKHNHGTLPLSLYSPPPLSGALHTVQGTLAQEGYVVSNVQSHSCGPNIQHPLPKLVCVSHVPTGTHRHASTSGNALLLVEVQKSMLQLAQPTHPLMQ